ncbi:caeA [Symbiodinium natans]|uniref:CaeA protein n=1 Tax=Symbiodinium natans TaxID=878477 RepID=A0A812RXE2_9DINO|nr:caeA [Symbiodinium natans]
MPRVLPAISLALVGLATIIDDAELPEDFCEQEPEEDLSLRQLRGRKMMKPDGVASTEDQAGSKWSFTDPDPEILIWDTWLEDSVYAPAGQQVAVGWLKTPLVHDPDMSPYEAVPYVCLRVKGIPAMNQPAKHGLLLGHCGGPGSDNNCLLNVPMDINGEGSASTLSADFDVWSISQRGVGLGEEVNDTPSCPFKYASGGDILPFPEIKCNEILTNPYFSEVEDRTFVELIMGGNNDTSERIVNQSMEYIVKILRTPDMTQTESGIMAYNETLVRWYYRLMKLEFSYCYEAARFKLQSPSGREYNALQFGGTMDLVQDIDQFRRAVGAPKLSIYGMSYGTSVAGVYGTVFPESTQHLILDGVVDPFPDVEQRGDLFAKGITATFNGIVKACDQTIELNVSKDEICPAAPLSETKALRMIQDRSQPLRAALLYLLANQALFQEGGDAKIEAVAALFLACVEKYWSGVDSDNCPSLLESLVQTDDAPITLSEDIFHFGMQAMVMGTDTAGRLNEEAMIQWWKESMAKQPIGTPWALTWVVGISTWPADARPVPPLGNDQVRPVIIGNLHDPNTAYTSAQLARSAFPRGHLVTYQGYGHCLDKSNLAGLGKELYDSYKKDVASHHLSTYSNKMALYACTSRILNYIATGEQPLDGHTCLAPWAFRP